MTNQSRGPELVATRTGTGWRLAATILAAALVALVGFTRLVGSDLPDPTASPPPTKAPATYDPQTGVLSRSPDGLTYADGIPTGIDGQPVLRVHDALQVPVGRTVLVGGWYLSRTCRVAALGEPPRCPPPTISDVPLVNGQGDVRTEFVALDGRLGSSGARVVRATIEEDPTCLIQNFGRCQPRLKVLKQVWSG